MPGEVVCEDETLGDFSAVSNDRENRNLSRRGGVAMGAGGVVFPPVLFGDSRSSEGVVRRRRFVLNLVSRLRPAVVEASNDGLDLTRYADRTMTLETE